MNPGEEMRFNAGDPRRTQARMARNRHHIILGLPYGLIGVCRRIKIIRAKFAGIHTLPCCSRNVFFHSR
jgi:hypothetical protein